MSEDSKYILALIATVLLSSFFMIAIIGIPLGKGCGINEATHSFHHEIAACNKQRMSWNRLEIREGSKGFVRCIDHRTNRTKLVSVTY